jgi:hypothetical protein
MSLAAWTWLVGVLESDSRESLPAQTVSLVVPLVTFNVTAASSP